MTLDIHSVLGIDTAFTTLAEAEHELLVLGQRVAMPADTMVCTHEIRDAAPHYAFSIAFASQPAQDLVADVLSQFAGSPSLLLGTDGGTADTLTDELPTGLRQALAEVESRHGGRAVSFPGSERLVGTLSVGSAIDFSALDRVDVISGGVGEPSDLLVTRDFVRPRWKSGELVLAAMPAADGALAPFEVPNPTACCAEHG